MSEVRAAGWYPDPHDDRSERWWGGTVWTASTRPLNHTLAQPPSLPPPRGKRGRVVKALCAILLGLLIVTLGVGMYFSTRTPGNMSATTSGTVTDVQIEHHPQSSLSRSQSSPTCHTDVVFLVGAKEYPVSTTGVEPCPWGIGEQVTVAYDPASPASTMIPSEGAVRYVPAMIVGIGALLVVFVFVRSAADLGWTANTRPLNQAPGQVRRRPGSSQNGGVPGQSAGAPRRLRLRWGPNGPARVHKTICAIFMLLAGSMFLGLGAYGAFFSPKPPGNMSATDTGTVTSVEVGPLTRMGNGFTRSCTPVVEFGVGGKTYTASRPGERSLCSWTVGQQIAVAYDPASPANAMIPTGMSLWGALFLAGMGAMSVGVGVHLWRNRMRTTF